MNRLKYIIIAFVAITLFYACEKEEDFNYKPHSLVAKDIDSVAIVINQIRLLKNGTSELKLATELHQFYYYERKGSDGEIKKTKLSHELPNTRLNSGDLKYFYQYKGKEPVAFTKSYFIADKNETADEVAIYVEVFGKKSVKKTIKLVKPVINEKIYTEKTIPVIFHLFENSELKNIDFKIEEEHLKAKIKEVNNAYRLLVDNTPNGMDTKVNFALAVYAPDGSKLKNPGMHVVKMDAKTVEEEYKEKTDKKKFDFNDYIKIKGDTWDYKRYFNVWVVPTKNGLKLDFLPKYILKGNEKPEGLKLTEVDADKGEYTALEIGAVMDYSKFSKDMFGKVAGTWLGLLDTGYEGDKPTEDIDFCDDTFTYEMKYEKKYLRKTAIFANIHYESTNVMDLTSLSTTVTYEQTKRILQIVNYSPTRQCWKSNSALKK